MKLSNKNMLSIIDPHLIMEWDFDKNDKLPSDFSYGSGISVCWKCSVCGHKWKTKICYRHHGNGCPRCKRKKVRNGNSLWHKNYQLSKEWNLRKNHGLTSKMFTPNSHKVVWWKCRTCNFEWEESINKRNMTGDSCFRCRSLAIKCPQLIKEWHPTKNLPLTPYDITFRSKKVIWWKCKVCGYDWKINPGNRIGGTNCPACPKVKLKNGTVCDSWVEAYLFLQYKNKGVRFKYNKLYGKPMGKRRYDFYLIDENKYVEVTSFKSGSIGISWFKYLKNIVVKKKYVEKVLNAEFEFKNIFLSPKQINYVRNNM